MEESRKRRASTGMNAGLPDSSERVLIDKRGTRLMDLLLEMVVVEGTKEGAKHER